jgi:hypothetical protein
VEADAVHAITELKGKDYALFIFCIDVVVVVVVVADVVDNKRKGR